MLKESPEEARTLVDAIRHPQFRVAGYIDLCDATAAEQTQQRRELLSQALLHARSVAEADHRVIYLGQIGERLLALGEKEKARKIYDEGLEAAANLSTAGWSGCARGAFAESLSLLDLSAALRLIQDLQDRYEFDRASRQHRPQDRAFHTGTGGARFANAPRSMAAGPVRHPRLLRHGSAGPCSGSPHRRQGRKQPVPRRNSRRHRAGAGEDQ